MEQITLPLNDQLNIKTPYLVSIKLDINPSQDEITVYTYCQFNTGAECQHKHNVPLQTFEVHRLASNNWITAKWNDASDCWISTDLKADYKITHPKDQNCKADNLETLTLFCNTYDNAIDAINAKLKETIR